MFRSRTNYFNRALDHSFSPSSDLVAGPIVLKALRITHPTQTPRAPGGLLRGSQILSRAASELLQKSLKPHSNPPDWLAGGLAGWLAGWLANERKALLRSPQSSLRAPSGLPQSSIRPFPELLQGSPQNSFCAPSKFIQSPFRTPP